MSSTAATYTAEQIVAIGGNRWERAGKSRVYLNDWPALVGIEVERYNTGSLRSVFVGDRGLSNNKAGRLLAAKVYWENGAIVTDLEQKADAAGLSGADLVDALHTTIAARVGA